MTKPPDGSNRSGGLSGWNDSASWPAAIYEYDFIANKLACNQLQSLLGRSNRHRHHRPRPGEFCLDGIKIRAGVGNHRRPLDEKTRPRPMLPATLLLPMVIKTWLLKAIFASVRCM